MSQSNQHPSDDEIIAGFYNKATREEAFTQLVRKYQEQIYWFIRRNVLDHEDANDLTQDVFIRVWENLERYRGDSKVFYWMYRISVNTIKSFWQSNKKFDSISIDHKEARETFNRRGVRDMMEASEIQLKLQRAILRLPAQQRLIFQLRYYDELQYDEIAAILDLAIGTLKANYFKALKNLERFIKEDS